MNISLGTIDNIDEITNIVIEYRTFYGVQNQKAKDVKRFITDRIINNQSKIFIASDEHNHVIGFIQLYPSYSTVSLKPQWLLNDLYIKEPFRSRGVTTALMNAVKTHFQNTAKGFILVTDKTNTAAKAFYDSCGWQTGEYDFYTYFYS